jgi:hypothetical protein
MKFVGAYLLLMITGILPVCAQSTTDEQPAPTLQHRCATVAVTSNTPMLPLRFFETYLERREDFVSSHLALTNGQSEPDVLVRLDQGALQDTRIFILNRATGQTISATSNWTNYPGMVALDVMDGLRAVCPGSIADAPKHVLTAVACSQPASPLTSTSSMTACSHTSWIDNRELYESLRSNLKFKQSSIQLVPVCGSADATVEVTHNLGRTVEWTWTLKLRQGDSVATGRIVAYASRDAGAKIADAVAREMAIGRGDDTLIADGEPPRTQPEAVPSRTMHVGLMPSDFAVQDTRLDLTLDGERVTARDMQGHIVFSFALAEFRDARLRREWEQSLQLDWPVSLLAVTKYAGEHLYDPVTIHGWELPFNHVSVLATEVTGVIGYVGAGAVLAQVRTPWHRLELACDENGEIKTVTLQVPASGSKELVRELRAAASQQDQSCQSANVALMAGK